MSHVTLRLPASEINLLIVELDVTLLKFPHLFDFVQVYNKALVHVVQLSDALSAEDGWVLGAVEVFNSLVVDCAQVSLYFFTWVHIFLLEAFVKVY